MVDRLFESVKVYSIEGLGNGQQIYSWAP